MANEISIRIGGDTSGFTKAARDVSTASDRMRNSMKDAAGATPALNNALVETGAALKNNVKPGADQAANAMLNLGRIVQDAPFGFIGIQNNINPMLESFQRLKLETGSTGGAFKALVASLTGGAGLGLAVSLVTSALTAFSISSRGATQEVEGFAKAQKDANVEAGKQLAHVQVLNAVLTDSTRSQSDRKNASKELSDILKDLNIKMSQEAILNGQVAEATKLATAAILARAKARAAEDRIAELSGQQLQRDIKRKEAVDQLTKAQANLNVQQKIQQQVTGGSTTGTAGNTIAATQKVISLQGEIKDLDKATAGANKEIQQLLGTITSQDLNVDFKGAGTEKEVDLLKQRIAALKEIQSLQGLTAAQQVELVQLEIKLVNRDGPKLGFKPSEIQQQADAILEQAFPVKTFEYEVKPVLIQDPIVLTNDFKTDIAKAVNPSGKPIEIPSPTITMTGVSKEVQRAIDQFRSMVTEGLSGTADLIGAAFAGIINGEGLGTTLANAAKGLMNIIGGILQQIGRNMILASAAVEALTAALNNLFGIGGAVKGLAAGALLVAVGGLIKNIDIPKFATGGIATRPTLGIFGEAGPEAIMPLNKIPGLINESLMRTLPKILANVNVSNQQPVILNGNLRVSGTDLTLMLERAQSRRARLG